MTVAFLYNGSFDRLAHGEEEPKGFVLIDDDGSTARVRFVENPDATPFLTLTFDETVGHEAAMAHFVETVETYARHVRVFIRVIHPDPAWRQGLMRFAKTAYPKLRLSVKPPRDRSAPTDAMSEESQDFPSLTKPTEVTLPSLILEYGDVTTKPTGMSEEKIRYLLRTLSQV